MGGGTFPYRLVVCIGIGGGIWPYGWGGEEYWLERRPPLWFLRPRPALAQLQDRLSYVV